MTRRLEVFNKLERFVLGSLPILSDNNQAKFGSLTSHDLLGIVLALSGVRCVDSEINPDTKMKSTLSLLYPPSGGGDGHYETTWTDGENPDWHSPFSLERESPLQDHYKIVHEGETVAKGLQVNHIFTHPTNHYWYYSEIPTELVANPNHTCTQGCVLCSRKKTSGFQANDPEYINSHVHAVVKDFKHRFPNENLKSLTTVHITTGSQATPREELTMMLEIMEAYKEVGFSNAKFELYSSQLPISESSLKELLAYPMIAYAATVEVTNNQLRNQLWGFKKGSLSLEEHVARVNLAERELTARNGYTEVNMVVGLESRKNTLEMLTHFPHSVIVPNIYRPYNIEGLNLVNDDVWKTGIKYFIEVINETIEHNQKVRPINPKVASAKQWLRDHGKSDIIPRRRWF